MPRWTEGGEAGRVLEEPPKSWRVREAAAACRRRQECECPPRRSCRAATAGEDRGSKEAAVGRSLARSLALLAPEASGPSGGGGAKRPTGCYSGARGQRPEGATRAGEEERVTPAPSPPLLLLRFRPASSPSPHFPLPIALCPRDGPKKEMTTNDPVLTQKEKEKEEKKSHPVSWKPI